MYKHFINLLCLLLCRKDIVHIYNYVNFFEVIMEIDAFILSVHENINSFLEECGIKSNILGSEMISQLVIDDFIDHRLWKIKFHSHVKSLYLS